MAFRCSWVDLPDCYQRDLDLEETAFHAYYPCPQARPFWDYVGKLTAHIALNQLVLIDLTYECDNVQPLYSWVKQMVFLTLLAMARLVIWMMRKKGILRHKCYSHQVLIRHFRPQLKVKIRTEESVWCRHISTKGG